MVTLARQRGHSRVRGSRSREVERLLPTHGPHVCHANYTVTSCIDAFHLTSAFGRLGEHELIMMHEDVAMLLVPDGWHPGARLSLPVTVNFTPPPPQARFSPGCLSLSLPCFV